jgi:hypothetical protein
VRFSSYDVLGGPPIFWPASRSASCWSSCRQWRSSFLRLLLFCLLFLAGILTMLEMWVSDSRSTCSEWEEKWTYWNFVAIDGIIRKQLSRACQNHPANKSGVKLIYDRLYAGQCVLVSGSHLEHMTRCLFSVWRLRSCWCVAPSLTREWVCNLLVQLFLILARAVTLGSKSRRTHDHILLSHLRLPQHGVPGPCIYIPQ